MKFFVIIWFLMLNFPAQAEKKCSFTLECKSSGHTFSIDFRSPSEDCAEDDMSVAFLSGKTSKQLEIEKSWYFYTDHISKTQESVCKSPEETNSFAAYHVSKNKIILFIKSSGRPGYDVVNAILVDIAQKKVLDKLKLGSSRNNFIAVLSEKTGFQVRIVRDSLSFHKKVSSDCDAPFVDDWMSIKVMGHKLVKKWLHN